jgi:hypothetical protein
MKPQEETIAYTWSGGGIPFGYSYNQDERVLTPDTREMQILQRIFRMASEGKGAYEITNTLNKEKIESRHGKNWTVTMIRGLLFEPRLEFYSGYYKGKKGNWQPILDQHTREKILQHKSTKEDVSNKQEKKREFLLSGLGVVKCGYCGGSVKSVVVARKNTKQFKYYYCTNRQVSGESICPNSKLVNMEILDKIILSDIKIKISNSETIIKKYIPNEIKRIDAEIEKHRKTLAQTLTSGKVGGKDLQSILLNAELVIKELNSIKERQVSPKKVRNDNKLLIKENVEIIKLYADRVEIIYKYPINAELERMSTISLEN